MKLLPSSILSFAAAATFWDCSSANAFEPYAQVTVDGFTSISGGQDSGTAGLALFDLGGEFDLSPIHSDRNLTFNFNLFYLEGRSPSTRFVGDSFAVSNLDSDFGHPRLFEAAFHGDLGGEALQFSIGQIATDSNFFASETAAHFLNASFGWAPGAMQSGAPAYAQASFGLLLDWHPSNSLSLLSGLYSTDIGDPETSRSARHGFNWELPSSDQHVWYNEIHYTLATDDLIATFKLGGWIERGDFADHASAASHQQNSGFYVIADQVQFGESPLQGFVRYAKSPSDRNLFSSYLDFGISGPSPFPGRGSDAWGIAYGIGKVSHAFKLQKPARNESLIELSWLIQIQNSFSLQPSLQFVANPSGPEGETIDDALVFGLRMQKSW